MSVKPELKIIADHLRSSSFLVADGVLPSNEGRGYVLRRIMRRAMRQLHKLGAKEASMYKLVDALIKEMGSAYPELSRAREVIVETLKNEEEKFRETLEKGLKILDSEVMLSLSKHDSSPKPESCFDKLSMTNLFSGSVAFKLYDTYGFPLDLTQDILKEKNLEVDIEEFNREMESQRERARKNWVGSGEEKEEKIFFDLKEKFGETKFLGYETLESKAKVLAILSNGKELEKTPSPLEGEGWGEGSRFSIILDQTPFYATSGGQKGDDGKIGDVEIFETKKFAGNLFVHFFEKQESNLKVGDEVLAIVNAKTRKQRAQNHSATHLLHKALKTVLGNSISQKGSNVDAKYFTFDFNFNRAMSVEEIQKVEDLVNAEIQKNSSVNTNLMSLEKARESGAEALFGEKYDAEVRVVAMGNSIELCGGTHAKNTGEIEILKIISEKGIAAGIRRIEARTGDEAKKYLDEQEEKLNNFVKELLEKNKKKAEEILALGGANPVFTSTEDDLEKFAEILQSEIKKREKEIENLKRKKLQEEIKFLKVEGNFVAHEFKNVDAKDLREIAVEISNKNNCLTFVYASKDTASSLVAISVPKNLAGKINANNLMKEINAKGGGKPDLVTGSIANSDLAKAIEVLKKV